MRASAARWRTSLHGAEPPVDFAAMRVSRAIVALVAIVVPLATAGAAAAGEPGVTVDPDSPAGREYAFPLDTHRAAAVGRDAVQGAAQPLFGVGIRRAGARASDRSARSSASSASSTSSTSRSGSKRTSRSRPSGGAASPRRGAAAPHGAALVELSQPRSTTADVGLIVLAVVLGGLAAGAVFAVAARRRA